MTPEQWDRVCHLVAELARGENAEDDLCDVALAACFLLPANRRLREVRIHARRARQTQYLRRKRAKAADAAEQTSPN